MRDVLQLNEAEDVDFVWPWDIKSSAKFLAVSAQTLEDLLAWRRTFIGQKNRWDFVLGTAEVPKFSVCARCVREHKAIHYCVESRFDFVTLCPVHGCPMFLKHRNPGENQPYVKNWIAASVHSRVRRATAPYQSSRFRLERRIYRAMRIGYEKHLTLGLIPAQSLLAAEAWRLRPPTMT